MEGIQCFILGKLLITYVQFENFVISETKLDHNSFPSAQIQTR